MPTCFDGSRRANAMANVCFEPAEVQKSTDYQDVGRGRGAYEQMKTFTFVGKNEGSYDQIETPPRRTLKGQSCRRCCGWCFLLSVSAVIGAVAYSAYVMIADSTSNTGTVKMQSGSDGENKWPEFNCTAEGGQEESWPLDRKNYCCLHTHVGCPDPYQCHFKSDKEREAWSVNRRAWCCEFKKKGCPHTPNTTSTSTSSATTTTTTSSFWWAPATTATTATAHHASTTTQEASTTKVTAQRSTTKQPLVPLDLNCAHDWEKRETAWSSSKKAHCCERIGATCPMPVTSTARAEYDCKTEAKWKTAWSEKRKAWCCEHKQTACIEDDSTDEKKGEEQQSGFQQLQGFLGHTFR